VHLLTKSNLVFVGRVNGNTFDNNKFWRTSAGSWYSGGLANTFFQDNDWSKNSFWNDVDGYSVDLIPTGVGNENRQIHD